MDKFQFFKSMELAKSALNYRSIRSDLINSNMANVDTPYYRPKDIHFESHLIEESNKLFSVSDSKKLELAKTDNQHLDPIEDIDNGKATLFFRDGHLARNDGNSVDLDVETTEMGKNGVMYNALVEGLKKQSAIFRTVIDASGKLQ